MREMHERVRNNDAASVHIEVANDQNARGFTSSAAVWISIATANVLPEVLSPASFGLFFELYHCVANLSGALAAVLSDYLCPRAKYHQSGIG
jgi:hypothetical protein